MKLGRRKETAVCMWPNLESHLEVTVGSGQSQSHTEGDKERHRVHLDATLSQWVIHIFVSMHTLGFLI